MESARSADARQRETGDDFDHGLRLKPDLSGNLDGSIDAGFGIVQRGQTRVEAGVTMAREGATFRPDDPALTVHTPHGLVHLAGPRAASGPQVTLNPDGSITVVISVYNGTVVDIGLTVHLRHQDGRGLVADRPEVTLRPGKRPARVSCRFHAARHDHIVPGERLIVEVDVDGVRAAAATVRVYKKPMLGLWVALMAVVVAVLGASLTLLVDRLDHRALSAPAPAASASEAPPAEPIDGPTPSPPTDTDPATGASRQPPIPVLGPGPQVLVSPTTTVAPTPPTTTPTVAVETQCLPVVIQNLLDGLGPLPLIGRLGDLLSLDERTCLPVLDLNRCISAVRDAAATPGALPGQVPSVVSACTPVNVPLVG